MKTEKSKVDTLIEISPNTWHASNFIHISPQDSECMLDDCLDECELIRMCMNSKFNWDYENSAT